MVSDCIASGVRMNKRDAASEVGNAERADYPRSSPRSVAQATCRGRWWSLSAVAKAKTENAEHFKGQTNQRKTFDYGQRPDCESNRELDLALE